MAQSLSNVYRHCQSLPIFKLAIGPFSTSQVQYHIEQLASPEPRLDQVASFLSHVLLCELEVFARNNSVQRSQRASKRVASFFHTPWATLLLNTLTGLLHETDVVLAGLVPHLMRALLSVARQDHLTHPTHLLCVTLAEQITMQMFARTVPSEWPFTEKERHLFASAQQTSTSSHQTRVDHVAPTSLCTDELFSSVLLHLCEICTESTTAIERMPISEKSLSSVHSVSTTAQGTEAPLAPHICMHKVLRRLTRIRLLLGGYAISRGLCVRAWQQHIQHVLDTLSHSLERVFASALCDQDSAPLQPNAHSLHTQPQAPTIAPALSGVCCELFWAIRLLSSPSFAFHLRAYKIIEVAGKFVARSPQACQALLDETTVLLKHFNSLAQPPPSTVHSLNRDALNLCVSIGQCAKQHIDANAFWAADWLSNSFDMFLMLQPTLAASFLQDRFSTALPSTQSHLLWLLHEHLGKLTRLNLVDISFVLCLLRLDQSHSFEMHFDLLTVLWGNPSMPLELSPLPAHGTESDVLLNYCKSLVQFCNELDFSLGESAQAPNSVNSGSTLPADQSPSVSRSIVEHANETVRDISMSEMFDSESLVPRCCDLLCLVLPSLLQHHWGAFADALQPRVFATIYLYGDDAGRKLLNVLLSCTTTESEHTLLDEVTLGTVVTHRFASFADRVLACICSAFGTHTHEAENAMISASLLHCVEDVHAVLFNFEATLPCTSLHSAKAAHFNWELLHYTQLLPIISRTCTIAVEAAETLLNNTPDLHVSTHSDLLRDTMEQYAPTLSSSNQGHVDCPTAPAASHTSATQDTPSPDQALCACSVPSHVPLQASLAIAVLVADCALAASFSVSHLPNLVTPDPDQPSRSRRAESREADQEYARFVSACTSSMFSSLVSNLAALSATITTVGASDFSTLWYLTVVRRLCTGATSQGLARFGVAAHSQSRSSQANTQSKPRQLGLPPRAALFPWCPTTCCTCSAMLAIRKPLRLHLSQFTQTQLWGLFQGFALVLQGMVPLALEPETTRLNLHPEDELVQERYRRMQLSGGFVRLTHPKHLICLRTFTQPIKGISSYIEALLPSLRVWNLDEAAGVIAESLVTSYASAIGDITHPLHVSLASLLSRAASIHLPTAALRTLLGSVEPRVASTACLDPLISLESVQHEAATALHFASDAEHVHTTHPVQDAHVAGEAYTIALWLKLSDKCTSHGSHTHSQQQHPQATPDVSITPLATVISTRLWADHAVSAATSLQLVGERTIRISTWTTDIATRACTDGNRDHVRFQDALPSAREWIHLAVVHTRKHNAVGRANQGQVDLYVNGKRTASNDLIFPSLSLEDGMPSTVSSPPKAKSQTFEERVTSTLLLNTLSPPVKRETLQLLDDARGQQSFPQPTNTSLAKERPSSPSLFTMLGRTVSGLFSQSASAEPSNAPSTNPPSTTTPTRPSSAASATGQAPVGKTSVSTSDAIQQRGVTQQQTSEYQTSLLDEDHAVSLAQAPHRPGSLSTLLQVLESDDDLSLDHDPDAPSHPSTDNQVLSAFVVGESSSEAAARDAVFQEFLPATRRAAVLEHQCIHDWCLHIASYTGSLLSPSTTQPASVAPTACSSPFPFEYNRHRAWSINTCHLFHRALDPHVLRAMFIRGLDSGSFFDVSIPSNRVNIHFVESEVLSVSSAALKNAMSNPLSDQERFRPLADLDNHIRFVLRPANKCVYFRSGASMQPQPFIVWTPHSFYAPTPITSHSPAHVEDTPQPLIPSTQSEGARAPQLRQRHVLADALVEAGGIKLLLYFLDKLPPSQAIQCATLEVLFNAVNQHTDLCREFESLGGYSLIRNFLSTRGQLGETLLAVLLAASTIRIAKQASSSQPPIADTQSDLLIVNRSCFVHCILHNSVWSKASVPMQLLRIKLVHRLIDPSKTCFARLNALQLINQSGSAALSELFWGWTHSEPWLDARVGIASIALFDTLIKHHVEVLAPAAELTFLMRLITSSSPMDSSSKGRRSRSIFRQPFNVTVPSERFSGSFPKPFSRSASQDESVMSEAVSEVAEAASSDAPHLDVPISTDDSITMLGLEALDGSQVEERGSARARSEGTSSAASGRAQPEVSSSHYCMTFQEQRPTNSEPLGTDTFFPLEADYMDRKAQDPLVCMLETLLQELEQCPCAADGAASPDDTVTDLRDLSTVTHLPSASEFAVSPWSSSRRRRSRAASYSSQTDTLQRGSDNPVRFASLDTWLQSIVTLPHSHHRMTIGLLALLSETLDWFLEHGCSVGILDIQCPVGLLLMLSDEQTPVVRQLVLQLVCKLHKLDLPTFSRHFEEADTWHLLASQVSSHRVTPILVVTALCAVVGRFELELLPFQPISTCIDRTCLGFTRGVAVHAATATVRPPRAEEVFKVFNDMLSATALESSPNEQLQSASLTLFTTMLPQITDPYLCQLSLKAFRQLLNRYPSLIEVCFDHNIVSVLCKTVSSISERFSLARPYSTQRDTLHRSTAATELFPVEESEMAQSAYSSMKLLMKSVLSLLDLLCAKYISPLIHSEATWSKGLQLLESTLWTVSRWPMSPLDNASMANTIIDGVVSDSIFRTAGDLERSSKRRSVMLHILMLASTHLMYNTGHVIDVELNVNGSPAQPVPQPSLAASTPMKAAAVPSPHFSSLSSPEHSAHPSTRASKVPSPVAPGSEGPHTTADLSAGPDPWEVATRNSFRLIGTVCLGFREFARALLSHQTLSWFGSVRIPSVQDTDVPSGDRRAVEVLQDFLCFVLLIQQRSTTLIPGICYFQDKPLLQMLSSDGSAASAVLCLLDELTQSAADTTVKESLLTAYTELNAMIPQRSSGTGDVEVYVQGETYGLKGIRAALEQNARTHLTGLQTWFESMLKREHAKTKQKPTVSRLKNKGLEFMLSIRRDVMQRDDQFNLQQRALLVNWKRLRVADQVQGFLWYAPPEHQVWMLDPTETPQRQRLLLMPCRFPLKYKLYRTHVSDPAVGSADNAPERQSASGEPSSARAHQCLVAGDCKYRREATVQQDASLTIWNDLLAAIQPAVPTINAILSRHDSQSDEPLALDLLAPPQHIVTALSVLLSILQTLDDSSPFSSDFVDALHCVISPVLLTVGQQPEADSKVAENIGTIAVAVSSQFSPQSEHQPTAAGGAGLSRDTRDDAVSIQPSESLQGGDVVAHHVSGCLITPQSTIDGEIIVGQTHLYFKPEEHTMTAVSTLRQFSAIGNDVYHHPHWSISKVVEVQPRRHVLEHTGFEVFFLHGLTLYFATKERKDRDAVCDALLKAIATRHSHSPQQPMPGMMSHSLQLSIYNKDGSQGESTGTKRAKPRIIDVSKLFSSRAANIGGLDQPEKEVVKLHCARWQRGELTNFEYLMILNTMAGRMYNDLSQYPVFPYLLADYTSEELDLSNPATFRDLAKPMGAQTEKRLQSALERYEMLQESDSMLTPYIFGTHYSNAGTVLYYTTRLEPFTQLLYQFQDNSYDNPARMFNDVATAWRLSSELSSSDFKELIPEFFYLPSFLYNINHYPLPTLEGRSIDSVRLPPWAHGCPHRFVWKYAEALESPFVSQMLPSWIDLIFGFKQRGDKAVEANNLFLADCYEGKGYTGDDKVELDAKHGKIKHFGQIPRQLFNDPHPSRLPAVLQQDASACAYTRSGLAEIHFEKLGKLASRHPTLLKESSLEGTAGVASAQSRQQLRLGGDVRAERVSASTPASQRLILDGFRLRVDIGGWDNSLRVVDRKTHKTFAVAPPESMKGWTASAVVEDRAMLIVGFESGIVRLYLFEAKVNSEGELAEVRLVQEQSLLCHSDKVLCISTNSSVGYFVTGSEDCTAAIWHLNRQELIRTLTHDAPVTACATSATTGYISTVSCPACSVVSRWYRRTGANTCILRVWDPNGTEMGSPRVMDAISTIELSALPLGNPNNVVLAGHHDGSISVVAQLTAELVFKIAAPYHQRVSSILYNDEHSFFVAYQDATTFIGTSRRAEML
eukprot:m.118390 g.118390  ORF g.118390 m.118390 type:complete len:3972 (+) comp13653_c0_seq4:233-12148(+)